MSAQDLRPVFLSGQRVYLRGMVEEDKERGGAWLDETFPVNATRAEKALEEEHQGPPWARTRRRLAIVRAEGDDVVGSVQVSTWDGFRTSRVGFEMATWLPDADALRAEALRLVVPWLRDETELMVVTLEVAADQPETIAAAEALGMVRNGRIRDWFGRPGGRADCLV
jgi:RimJ/RimL family protein N-acetyltransferase